MHDEEKKSFLRNSAEIEVNRIDRGRGGSSITSSSLRLISSFGSAFLFAVLFSSAFKSVFSSTTVTVNKDKGSSCDDPNNGYQCRPDISRSWGQYSPYFSTPSSIEDVLPEDCEVTFAQILSRHGARDPTLKRTLKYSNTIIKIQVTALNLTGKYAFLKKYRYSLGADQLNEFGRQEMRNSGAKFYERYKELTQVNVPFIRTAGQQRVVESADAWMDGFHGAKQSDKSANKDKDYPYFKVIINEGPEFNNTLDHSTCINLEEGPMSKIRKDAKDAWIQVYGFPILARLRNDLPESNIQMNDVHNLMSMCPFDTVHHAKGHISPFCDLFTEEEWQQYNHLESLDKFYGWGKGNPLGPTQGVGFTNELLARLTNTPVDDHTSTNSTLDSNSTTFPIDKKHKVFADFSHDNDLTAIFFAMGLYNSTPMLSISQVDSIAFTEGWSSAWTVPFSARAYFEKMRCKSRGDEELIRVIVNDRVLPLEFCNADQLGRCTLGDFVASQTFAQQGGHWEQCFQSTGEELLTLPSGRVWDTSLPLPEMFDL